jgi:hypothetical protein
VKIGQRIRRRPHRFAIWVASLAFALLMIASRYYWVTYVNNACVVSLYVTSVGVYEQNGTVRPKRWVHNPPMGFRIAEIDKSIRPPLGDFISRFIRLPRIEIDRKGIRYVRVSLAAPALMLLMVSTYLFWKNPRKLPGKCINCRYDLTGNTSGKCPECGTAIQPQALASSKAYMRRTCKPSSGPPMTELDAFH